MAFPSNETDIRARLDAIDAQIEELTASWETLVDYRLGDRSVSKTVALAALQAERALMLERLAKLPSEEINVYDDPDL